MHGRGLEEAALREAISRVLYYASQINTFLDGRNVGFRPFVGDLRGFVAGLRRLTNPHHDGFSRVWGSILLRPNKSMHATCETHARDGRRYTA
jgi:hypothetical protein